MKYLFHFLILLVLLFITSLAFNHVNAWIGVILVIGIVIGVFYYFKQLIKKQNEKD